MSEKHTPGPWRYDGRAYIWGPKSEMVAMTHEDTEYIALIRGAGEALPMDANARLIAAAPELLDACWKLANEAAGFLALSDIERHGMTNSRILRQRLEEARDAIRKAKGQ